MEENLAASAEEEMNGGDKELDDGLEANVVGEDEEPSPGMKFSSEDEITRYYQNYARNKGFGIIKISSKNGDDGKKYFTLACSRARKYVSNSKNLLKPNPVTKTQCKARLNVCVSLEGIINVKSVVVEHNHELSPTKARYFRCNKNMGPRIKVDQIVQKKLTTKRAPRNSQKSNKVCTSSVQGKQNKELLGSQVIGGIGTQESIQVCTSSVQGKQTKELLGSQVIGGFGTQESIQCEQNYFWRNELGTTSKLAPFNPNQETTIHNASYSELLQAQHHINDQLLP